MNGLAPMRRTFIIALAVLSAINVGLGAYLLWPGRPTQAKQHQEETKLRDEFQNMTHQVEPLQGMDQKLIKTRDDVKKFYSEHVASRWSEVSEEINKLARENGFAPPPIRYKTESTKLPDVQRVDADIILAGEYPKIAHFINALERDKLVFNIIQITLNGEQGGSAVDLQIEVVTFLRETT